MCAKTGRTLEEYCHDGKSGCKLYHTKKGTTPVEMRGMLQAAYMLRARHQAGLDKHIDYYPYWAEQAYLVANAVIQQVENERTESDGSEDENSFMLTGKGDSGAFSAIYEFMQERGLRAKE